MNNNQMVNVLTSILTIMICILFGLIGLWLFLKLKMVYAKNENNNDNTEGKKNIRKSKVALEYNEHSVFDFMEFDKIEDNMIILKDGIKFVMIVKCQGINYDLMSGVEKTAVEQGFLQFLNALRYPIQIYVQARTVDLTGSINTYKQKVRSIGDELAQKEFEFNQKVREGKYSQYDLDKDKFEIVKNRNLYEYGMDIVNNTEMMSQNRNILSKQYYVVLEYYPEDVENYAKDEINSMAFAELYTRAQSTISLLSVCGINGKILDSIEIADLLYRAYNRDESEIYDLRKAINAGYDNIYQTAVDVLEKRMKELDKKIEVEAIRKANEAVFKVKNEREKEIQLAEKEKNIDDLIDKMAEMVLERNKNIVGNDIAEEAKEIIRKNRKEGKEEKSNEQKKSKGTKRVSKS